MIGAEMADKVTPPNDLTSTLNLRQLRLDTAETKIGRDINNEICLDDITVSRSHALISKSDGYTIKDLGSLNGTYLNAVVVREAKINAGDEVQIGKYHLTLFIGGNK